MTAAAASIIGAGFQSPEGRLFMVLEDDGSWCLLERLDRKGREHRTIQVQRNELNDWKTSDGLCVLAGLHVAAKSLYTRKPWHPELLVTALGRHQRLTDRLIRTDDGRMLQDALKRQPKVLEALLAAETKALLKTLS